MNRNHTNFISLVTQQGGFTGPVNLISQPVRNAGFPGGVTPANTMQRSHGTITALSTNRRLFVYSSARANGSSGGPVLRGNVAWGIHTGGNAQGNSIAVTICQQFLDRLAFNM